MAVSVPLRCSALCSRWIDKPISYRGELSFLPRSWPKFRSRNDNNLFTRVRKNVISWGWIIFRDGWKFRIVASFLLLFSQDRIEINQNIVSFPRKLYINFPPSIRNSSRGFPFSSRQIRGNRGYRFPFSLSRIISRIYDSHCRV